MKKIFNKLLKKTEINNNRGVAIIMGLIVLCVMSAFGAILYEYAIIDTKHTAMDEDAIKAYYTARSGAHAYVTYITSNPDQLKLDQLLTFINNSSTSSGRIKDETFNISVDTSQLVGAGYIIITSTSTVKAAHKSVKVKLSIRKGINLFDCGITTKSSLVFDRNSQLTKVYSNLKSASTVTPPRSFGPPYHYSEFQPFLFPPVNINDYAVVNSPGTRLIVGNHANVTVEQSATYKSTASNNYGIEVSNNAVLTFKTNNYPDGMVVVTDTLYSKGKIYVDGAYPLYLIITKSLSTQTAGNINVLPLKDPSLYTAQELKDKVGKLKILMLPSSTYTQQAGEEFCGSIYAVGASLNINSGNCNFYGAVVCDIFNGANNSIFTEVIPENFADIDNAGYFKVELWYE